MSGTDTKSEITRRLRTIEATIEEKLRGLFASKPPTPEVAEKAAALHSKSDELAKKMDDKQGSVWDAVKDEVRHDLDALEGDFRHWIDYLDKHYRD